MPDPEPKSELPPVSGAVRACGPTETDPFDDMHDNQSDWDQYAALLPLGWCCKMGDAFDEADREAIKYQKRHRGVTYVAAAVATLAVVLAIAGLGYGAASGSKPGSHSGNPQSAKWQDRLDWDDWLELVAALVTISVVGVGFGLRYKKKWLRFRHRAELYRLLRYRFLIRPSVWAGEGSPEAWIQAQRDEIDRLTGEADLKKALNQPSPPGPYESAQSRMSRHGLQALTQYYLAKRLGPQKEYLANRAQRNEIKDWMRSLLPFFFFGSILAVVAKFLLKLGDYPWSAFVFVLAAALLPVFAAGIRTYLAAFEFSRNKSRFYAAHKALSDTEKSLLQNTFVAVSSDPRQPIRQESVLIGSHLGQVIVVAEQAGAEGALNQEEIDAYPVLRDLAWSEHLLDAEHREWLRLMYDAEWFG